MQYLGDVWVNWFEGEENGYNVCPFHEWRKEDAIELLDQVPLIRVEEALLDRIENRLDELPAPLLEDVHNQSYIRKNNQRQPIEYCFVATDLKKIIAVDTMGYKIPLRKSRLIPRQEQTVLEKARETETRKYPLGKNEEKEYHILSPHPRLMCGLTRRERQLKQLLLMALDQLRTTGTAAEVRYWYTEWMPKKYFAIQQMSLDEAWGKLYEELKEGWSKKHEEICRRMIKGHPYFEKIWELEHGQHVK